MKMSEAKNENRSNRLLGQGALLALLALPGMSQAGTGIFALQAKTIANSQQYHLATVSNPGTYYSHCGNYSLLPYLLVAPGGFGHFGGNTQAQTDYYAGRMQKMVSALSPKCIRVIGIETTGYSPFDYSGSIVLPAEPAGADYWVNLPLRRAATYLRDVIRSVQADAAHSSAPRWFLQGGSASSLYSTKLLDVYRTSADASGSGFRFPVSTVLESLPNSGNIWNGCRYSNDISTVKYVLNTVYAYPFGSTACLTIVNNPTAHNWKFLTGAGLSTYLGSGKRIFIINGADDPIYKDGTSYLADSWTMDQMLINFASITGKCTGQGFINSSNIGAVNRNAFFNCEMNMYAGLYQNGGHGPVPSSNPYAIDDVVNSAIGPGAVRGVIDGVVNNNINGWACTYANRTPIDVHVFVGGSAGIGTIIGGYASNKPSEAAVGAACSGRGTTYRFSIPLSLAVRQAHRGKKIYIHGIHPTGGFNNDLIGNSGVFPVPAP